ncbi:MAG: hypothetical protein ACLRI7_14635 [Ruthenibacterium lactatiformans]
MRRNGKLHPDDRVLTGSPNMHPVFGDARWSRLRVGHVLSMEYRACGL